MSVASIQTNKLSLESLNVALIAVSGKSLNFDPLMRIGQIITDKWVLELEYHKKVAYLLCDDFNSLRSVYALLSSIGIN